MLGWCCVSGHLCNKSRSIHLSAMVHCLLDSSSLCIHLAALQHGWEVNHTCQGLQSRLRNALQVDGRHGVKHVSVKSLNHQCQKQGSCEAASVSKKTDAVKCERGIDGIEAACERMDVRLENQSICSNFCPQQTRSSFRLGWVKVGSCAVISSLENLLRN